MSVLREYARTVELAAGQDGVVTRAQLVRYGVDPHTIRRMLAVESALMAVRRGVYAVMPLWDIEWGWYQADYQALDPSRYSSEKHTVDAAIRGGVFSHWTAAQLLGCADVPFESHVTVGRRREIRGYRSWVRPVSAAEVTWAHGVPVTSVERTTRDLGAWAIDGEHRSRWMEHVVVGLGYDAATVCSWLGTEATRESWPYFEWKVG